MNTRLIAIAGILERTSFVMLEDEIFIGRDRANSLWINDASVSRQHCRLSRRNHEYHLEDLQSHNGTRVNGIPIQNRKLEQGDMIAIGDSLFLFLLHDEEADDSSANAVQLSEEMPNSQSTVQLRIEDALYLHPEKVLAALPPTARLARDLNALLKIGNAINSIQQLDPLQQTLLESVFEIVPAERAALLMNGDDADEFKITLGKQRSASEHRPVSVSRTIVNRVVQEGVALLSNEVLTDHSFDEAHSLLASQARSILCVPLIIFGNVFGVVYLDTTDSETPFDENHLQLVTAIASIAAIALNNAQHIERLEGDNRRLQEAIQLEHNMVGESEAMREVYKIIARVAPADSTVLIDGESGTGKELAARAIHQNSPRAPRTFVAINCAALTDSLLESELFGHEKGAFTGAIAQKKGKLEIADGGTVFLDEIGELAPLLQAKLLRVLQEREIDRVGGTRPVKIDIRLIAATNRNLEEEVRSGRFRQDLFYRLNVVRVTMPPLRARTGDVALLARYFVAKYADKCKRAVKGISIEARAYLNAYTWQGNVRELENTIERGVVLGTTGMILPEDLPEYILEVKPGSDAPANDYHQAVKKAKQQLILDALEQAEGSYIEAAKLLSIHPNNLHRLIRNLDLKPLLKK